MVRKWEKVLTSKDLRIESTGSSRMVMAYPTAALLIRTVGSPWALRI